MLFNLNLFSSFDLNSFMFGFYFMLFIFMMNFLKIMKSNFNIMYFQMFLNLFMMMIFSSLSPSFQNYFFKMMNMKIFLSLFYYIYFMNTFSLFFFSFSFTGMFFLNFSMILILWLGSMMNYIKKKSSFLEHLCPLGCPLSLSFFMVLIELISMMIQPIALILRLTINMISGHIMISLFSLLIMENLILSLITSFIFFPFLIMKFFICAIQTYIVSVLISMNYNQ